MLTANEHLRSEGPPVSDRRLIYVAAFVRALATGQMGVLLGIYLDKLNFTPAEIGIVIGVGLSGAALSTLIVTLLGDRLGRRRSLFVLALASAGGGIALIVTTHFAAVCVAVFLGMVNGMGRDRGAQLVVEQAILPVTVAPAHRTRAFAWYNVLQDIGHAAGSVLAAMPVMLREHAGFSELASFHIAVGVYAALCFIGAIVYRGLTPATEAHAARPVARLSMQSRRVLRKIAALFALDSLAGGFLGTALLAYFFYARFGVSEAAVALLFFFARLANASSHLAAAWLAARVGLVNTMVFTHVPSSLLLAIVPWAPSFGVAAVLFLLRECLVEMDVPTRQSYVMAVVQPEERVVASGTTHLVRMGGWAVAPFAAGPLMQGWSLATPLLIGAGLKVLYDIALYRAFHDLKPPEER